MPERVEVINMALEALDLPPSTGLTDTRTDVVRVRTSYEPTVKAMLAAHPWNFATDMEACSVAEEDPTGWDYKYNKPSGCLRLVRLNDSGDPFDDNEEHYEDRGGYLYSDLSPLYCWFVAQRWVSLEGSWPQPFADAVSAALAYRCAGRQTRNEDKRDRRKRDARDLLSTARTWDGQQMPFERLPSGAWIRARQASSLGRSGSE